MPGPAALRRPSGSAVKVEYLVDAHTYAPLRVSTTATLRNGRHAGASRLRLLKYERLPRTPANEKLLVLTR